ncbi:MAG: NUDIX hydrolase [Patescibacteria group bacterium]
MKSKKPWKTLSSKIVYQNHWMKVLEKRVIRSDGSRGVYGIVEKPDYGVTIPIAGKKIYLIQLYRYAVKAVSWEFPQGEWEKGESMVASARRELTEETGMKAKTMTRLGHLWLACGHHTQGYTVFLAEGCVRTGNFDTGEVDRVKGFSLTQILKMIRDGRIKDSQTVVAIQLFLNHRKKK